MKKSVILALLVLGSIVLMIGTASAIPPKPRPLPVLPPTTPVSNPVISAS